MSELRKNKKRVAARKGFALDALRIIPGRPVTLDSEDVGAKDEPAKAVWVQVALEGAYNGYEGGAFTFSKDTFDTIVQNLHDHPSFHAGADGVGDADVVPWDFHHASEVGPTSGTVPVMGAPAQGWVQDLQVRQGAEGSELWALTRWLEPARTYVLEGKYRWASVTVYFAARDGITGEQKGATLLSIALTNKPFIEGMQELVAASNDLPRRVGADLSYYCYAAKDAEDALRQLRGLFGLPATAGAADVIQQIAQVNSWIAGGGAPLGVDVGDFVSGMRTIFGLPALSSAEYVFAQASKLIESLVEQETDEGSNPMNAAPAPQNSSPPAAVATEKRTMDLIKKLAEKYGVVPTEAAVLEFIAALDGLRVALAKKLGLAEGASMGVVLDKGANVVDKLGAMAKMLGVEDADAAIAAVADQIKKVNEMTALMPELADLKDFKAKKDDEEATKDVDEAMASYSLPAICRDALLLVRKGKEGAKVLGEKYPKKAPVAAQAPAAGAPAPAAAPANAALLQSLVAANASGQERQVTQNADGSITLSAPGASPAAGGAVATTVINLTAVPGVNRMARLVEYVRVQLGDKADSTSYDAIFDRALTLAHSKEVKIIDVAA